MKKKPHPVDVHIGTALRRQRCYAGISQSELADSVGITYQQLQKYETAANRVSASRLWDLAQELGASIDSFFSSADLSQSDPVWLGDPVFAQWVRIYRDTPDESRKSLLKVVKVIAKERL